MKFHFGSILLWTTGNMTQADGSSDGLSNWFQNIIESTNYRVDAEPLDIIYDPTYNWVEALSDYINTYGLISLIQQIIVYGALISVLISLVIILFTQKSDMLAEKKADIIHKITLVLAGAAAVFIFSVVKSFFDSLFGML